MFNYRSHHAGSRVNLTTDRMMVRLVSLHDADRLANYYEQNREYLKPFEPIRDESYYYPASWRNRLALVTELQQQKSAFHFILLDPDENEIRGVANFSHILRGAFHACYLGYSLAEKWQGQGMMYEGLQATIRYMFRQQHLHRIMANYMPHNQRSGNLLKRLGFQQEGYAQNYLLINGSWQDHVLTALVNPDWKPAHRV